MTIGRKWAFDFRNSLPKDFKPITKKELKMTELRIAVVTELMASYEFTMDEAEETVAKSVIEDVEIWHAEANAGDIAKFLASDEDGE